MVTKSKIKKIEAKLNLNTLPMAIYEDYIHYMSGSMSKEQAQKKGVFRYMMYIAPIVINKNDREIRKKYYPLIDKSETSSNPNLRTELLIQMSKELDKNKIESEKYMALMKSALNRCDEVGYKSLYDKWVEENHDPNLHNNLQKSNAVGLRYHAETEM